VGFGTTPDHVITAAWEAFSSSTSMAALEILIATRAMRDPMASQRLAELGRMFAKLGRRDLGAVAAMNSTHTANRCSILGGLGLGARKPAAPCRF
jgi:hypothetical protein